LTRRAAASRTRRRRATTRAACTRTTLRRTGALSFFCPACKSARTSGLSPLAPPRQVQGPQAGALPERRARQVPCCASRGGCMPLCAPDTDAPDARRPGRGRGGYDRGVRHQRGRRRGLGRGGRPGARRCAAPVKPQAQQRARAQADACHAALQTRRPPRRSMRGSAGCRCCGAACGCTGRPGSLGSAGAQSRPPRGPVALPARPAGRENRPPPRRRPSHQARETRNPRRAWRRRSRSARTTRSRWPRRPRARCCRGSGCCARLPRAGPSPAWPPASRTWRAPVRSRCASLKRARPLSEPANAARRRAWPSMSLRRPSGCACWATSCSPSSRTCTTTCPRAVRAAPARAAAAPPAARPALLSGRRARRPAGGAADGGGLRHAGGRGRHRRLPPAPLVARPKRRHPAAGRARPLPTTPLLVPALVGRLRGAARRCAWWRW